MNSSQTEQARDTRQCDVCVVGAGYAGLNALVVASRYLSADQRVVLIDRHERPGGMWVDTYSYVRLHQPHRMFTAADIRWELDADPAHLATKTEVLDQMQRCLGEARKQVTVEECFGWEFVSGDEVDDRVLVTCKDRDGHTVVIETDKLIKAYGHNVARNDPLELSSKQVRSVSPDHDDLMSEMFIDDSPVWIIGGGKTGMDTAFTLLSRNPGREVNLVAGSGTWFVSRDRMFPTGMKRWWGGELNGSMWLKVGHRFDGTNEAEVWDWFRSKYGVWVTPDTGNCFFAYLSDAECDTIRNGLNDVIMDHLVDVVDREGAAQLSLRGDYRRTIPAGSWIVNCTGYLHRKMPSGDPYVSRGGRVLTLQSSAPMGSFPDYTGYYLTHLLFLGKLPDLPLYEVDVQELLRRNKPAAVITLMTAMLYNLSVVGDNVPPGVVLGTRFDFEHWYPKPRRMALVLKFLLAGRRRRSKWRQSLDTVAERFDVRCGPLPYVGGSAPKPA